MKTSFYFVIWIIIYPLLGLLHSPVIDRNSFIIALVAVYILSWLLNGRLAPIVAYERRLSGMKTLDTLYRGDIAGFIARLRWESIVQFVTAIYFGVTIVFVVFSLLSGSDVNEWIALIVFSIFAYGAITGASRLNEAVREIKGNPGIETCAAVARRLYGLDYAAFREHRAGAELQDLAGEAPHRFRSFQVISLVIAGICTVLGLVYLLSAFAGLFSDRGAETFSASVMYILYGSLALYFGARDSANIIRFLRNNP